MSPVEILRSTIEEKRKEIHALEAALRILGADVDSTPEVQSAPAPAPLPAATTEKTVVQAPIPKPAYTGPRCGACGAKMYQTARTMPSGVQVNLLKCNDSACGNEAYQ